MARPEWVTYSDEEIEEMILKLSIIKITPIPKRLILYISNMKKDFKNQVSIRQFVSY